MNLSFSMKSVRYQRLPNPFLRYSKKGLLPIILGIVGFLLGQEQIKPPVVIESPSITCKVAFSPNGQATNLIVTEINSAQLEILVQAYRLTSKPIIAALLKAQGRGVDVRVLLDKEANRSEAFFDLRRAKVPVLIDSKPAIAHNKVMVIDDQTVITGSFNFTNSAQSRNAENLLVLKSSELASIYKNNWLERFNLSR